MNYREKTPNEKIFNAFEEGTYDLCRYLCLEDIKTNPKNAYAWFYKGKSEFECDDFTDSINSLQRGISIEPEATLFRANLGQSFERNGNIKNAIKYYFLEVKKFPESLYGWQVLVPFLAKSNKYVIVKKICDEMVKNKSMDYTFLAEEYADSLYNSGTLDEELIFYQKLKELDIYPPWAEENHNFVLKDIVAKNP
jgi:tetratricopeptide (TPR) repeat protein